MTYDYDKMNITVEKGNKYHTHTQEQVCTQYSQYSEKLTIQK